jgi:ubiquinone/menaquinone biosynthesis C-methylase UbiE
MQFGRNAFYRYLQEAPLPLALERALECDILQRQEFARPILDVGCGDSIFASRVFDERIDVGLDPNGLEIERARTYGAYDELIESTGDKIPKPDGTFKTIFSNSVLEHIEDLGPVLDEMHRVLASDGVVYLTLPTEKFEKHTVAYQTLSLLGLRGTARSYARHFNRFWRHFHAYTVEDWAELFAKHGFEVSERIEYCPKSIGVLDDALAPFCLPNFLAKKALNRWFVWPKLRQVSAYVPYFMFKSYAKADSDTRDGGLVFFALRKAQS